jgi:phage tail sheath protein FI
VPTYLTPGVYVEEVPSTSKPIEGVGTSIAAFVGLAPGGPVNTPVRISNWTQFAKIFGDPNEPENGPFMDGAYLAHSVYGFFQNGGALCWIVRVGAPENGAGSRAVAALPAAADKGVEAYRAKALDGIGGTVKVEIAEEPNAGGGEGGDGKGGEITYKVTVDAGTAGKEEFDGLTLKKGRQNIATKVNAQSKLIAIEDLSGSLPEAQRAPAVGAYTLSTPAVAPEKVQATDFEGDVARRKGMGGLAAVDEITMVCMPDIMGLAAEGGDDVQVRDLQGKMIAHCEMAGDRMAILDSPPDMLPQEILEWRMNTAGYDSKFATLYYPWLEVMNPLTNQPLLVPPSGHVAGVWCRTDSTRGVHKAPANEVTLGVNGLGFRIWGARTLSSDPEWRYINVRRLFNYIAESIMEGTQWSVFEPNDERLWMQLRIAATNFLTRTWREGALFGSTPEQAFFVKCDAETNPPDVIEAGQVICEIGIAPVKPAEFVVFRLSQYSAGASEIEG